jgi:HK97 gp10 family phage protein
VSIRVIVEGLDELKRDLAEAPEKMRTNARKATQVTSVKMKRDMQSRAKRAAGTHARAYPSSITFDVAEEGDRVSSEIGPDKERPQGALGNILEGGSSTSAPHPHVTPAFEANKDDLVTGAEKAIEDSLW